MPLHRDTTYLKTPQAWLHMQDQAKAPTPSQTCCLNCSYVSQELTLDFKPETTLHRSQYEVCPLKPALVSKAEDAVRAQVKRIDPYLGAQTRSQRAG